METDYFMLRPWDVFCLFSEVLQDSLWKLGSQSRIAANPKSGIAGSQVAGSSGIAKDRLYKRTKKDMIKKLLVRDSM